jgi:hypothetical protein
MIDEFDLDQDGEISEAEFVSFVHCSGKQGKLAEHQTDLHHDRRSIVIVTLYHFIMSICSPGNRVCAKD